MSGRTIDVFNGDADGLCALHQLRLSEPAESWLITGPKREIGLLKRVEARPGDILTVLDIALSKNRDALDRVLDAGARVRWFDHHQPGELPRHPRFEAHIDLDAMMCTSLIVDAHLGGAHRAWAVVAAFGDNLADSARRAAAPLDLDLDALATLQSLGECLNYNGYGESLEDLFYDPAELYHQMRPYADPLAFATESPAYRVLQEGYAADMARAEAIRPAETGRGGAIYVLPAEKWARRVAGVFGNARANAEPERAHAVLTAKPQGGYVVSIRAPLADRRDADTLASQFETGGGRRAAAGINHLPASDYSRFVTAFHTLYP